jgi:hypothetical protein
MGNSRSGTGYFSSAITFTGVAVLGICLLLTMGGCGSEESNTVEADCSGVSVSFASDISPIIQANCTKSGCHGTGSNNGPGELLTFAQVNRAKAEIQSSVSSGAMPKDSRLTSNEKNSILCWIENGGSNN